MEHQQNSSKNILAALTLEAILGRSQRNSFSENCTDADKDGIADSAYEIKNGTYDYLPLTIIPASTTTHKALLTMFLQVEVLE
jgi:hypothetical protein